MLTVSQLTKKYADKTALSNADLQIDQGEFVALVGMSGGGKSTLLRLIAGLEEQTSGTLTFAGDRPVIRVMFQNDRLLPWMTVLQNVTFKQKTKQLQQQGRKMLALVGLADFADVYPAQLSGGQKQRVALARALMARPQLLLLDEPLGALDALTRRNMQDLILSVCRQQQLTTILVTHDVQEAARMADRIVVIKDHTNLYEEQVRDHQDPAEVAIVAERVLQEIVGEAS